MQDSTHQTVILGGGFAGLFTALHLQHCRYPYPVVLIDRSERFSFKPLLYEYFSEEMDTEQVCPAYAELLRESNVEFVCDDVESIDLQQRQVKLHSGRTYDYTNLVLGLGSVTNYFNIAGAQENTLPLRTAEDAIAIRKHIQACLAQAQNTQDVRERRKLLTVAVVGGGPSGVEMAATLADILPNWYSQQGGDINDIRIFLINHGQEILEGDINSQLRQVALEELKERTIPVELMLSTAATEIQLQSITYKHNEQTAQLAAGTIIWTAGTNINPIIKNLAISEDKRDKQGRLKITPTLQLLDFPEVFAGGDCATEIATSLPPTAQVAYQQGAAIAHNLIALSKGEELSPAQVNLRGTLLKLGLGTSVANIFNKFEVKGEAGHLIRQGTYLELLPTPKHNLQVTADWLKEEVFDHHLNAERSLRSPAMYASQRNQYRRSSKLLNLKRRLASFLLILGLLISGYTLFEAVRSKGDEHEQSVAKLDLVVCGLPLVLVSGFLLWQSNEQAKLQQKQV